MTSIPISAIEANQPGVEVGLVTPLRVDTGDTVVIGDVTITPSDSSTMTVSAASMNSSPVVIGTTEYPTSTVVLYTLTVTGSIAKDRQVSLSFAYTTQTGDQRIVVQHLTLKPNFTATGGVAVYGGGSIEVLTTAPSAALYPGLYDVNTSGGVFTVLLREVKGDWHFLDAANTTATNNLTIGTAGQTFNGAAGPLVMDGNVGVCRVYNVSGGTAYKVVV